jgi:uncharacterized membrane protein
MDDRALMLLLRLIHILAGVFWAGSAFVLAGFLIPTVRETGAEGGRFMGHLVTRRRLPVFIGIAMLLTVLSGLTMYGRTAAATHGTWPGTAPGIGYGVGGLAALLGGIIGMGVSGAAAKRMSAIGQSVGATGRPSPEQLAEIQRLQGRMQLGGRIAAGLIAVAVIAMATARYL